MEDIHFKATIGEREIPVRITSPPGSAGTVHLEIDGRIYGCFVYWQDRWEFRPYSDNNLTSDDIHILEEIMNEKMPGPLQI